MATGLSAVIQNIRQGINQMTANRESDALKICLDQTALLKLRIQSSGQNAQGSQFPDYVPAYKANRAKKGYQVAYVDLTRSGRLMASIMPRIVESNIFAAVVVIEGSDEQSKVILRGLSNKRGNVLEFSKEEIEQVRAANRRRILKYFQ